MQHNKELPLLLSTHAELSSFNNSVNESEAAKKHMTLVNRWQAPRYDHVTATKVGFA